VGGPVPAHSSFSQASPVFARKGIALNRKVTLSVSPLEDRSVPAVTSVVGFGTLTVFGDSAGNEIVVSRDALGVISVNGEVPLAGGIPGGFPTVFNTHTITVSGLGGNDVIRFDKANGPLPAGQL
jgi:hypothetical protein